MLTLVCSNIFKQLYTISDWTDPNLLNIGTQPLGR